MSELIKREDAINAVEMFFKDAYIEDSDVHCTDMVYEINHIPTASPWHRVEDELPDKTTAVLVWVGVNYDGWGMYPEMRTALWHTVQKRFFVHHNESIRGPIIGEVTHWMPLPEPPKEDA